MIKQPVKSIFSYLVIFSLLVGCYSPSMNVVEVKALFVSADIIQKNPLLNHYLDIAKLAEYLVTSFYIKQNVAKGKIPKKSTDDPFGKKHAQSGNWFISMVSSLEFKNISDNCVRTGFMHNYSMQAWLSMHVLDDTAPLAAVSTIYDRGMGIIMLMFLLAFIRARSDVSDLIINNLYTNGKTQLKF